MSHRAYIALGSNLHNPEQQVRRAFAELGDLPQTKLVAQSSLYRTAPVGYADQPDFVNAVAALDTELEPSALLAALLALETAHGRARSFPNAPRSLDLDVLMYDDLILQTAQLTLPHPRLHERGFVLFPLTEIAPDLEIPGHGAAHVLLKKLPDQNVRKMAA
ncbi:MAG: 2-amino-4-hydroxy-6-hydroxymethyldihydropteridine diphosphokinase [Methylobacillus sp.]|jgi:2-amino-4-hydroxy-6-hydroxymethyldihydropteridine diphosphokinase|nr:2-amino-4-hydroxy-6-hydroxymethyldihydropteridine diphosphokinase [Methylobacillus sp.]